MAPLSRFASSRQPQKNPEITIFPSPSVRYTFIILSVLTIGRNHDHRFPVPSSHRATTAPHNLHPEKRPHPAPLKSQFSNPKSPTTPEIPTPTDFDEFSQLEVKSQITLSEKRLAANRANALKSTGPRTQAANKPPPKTP